MISRCFAHADRYHGDTEIVSRACEGSIHRYTYREAHGRTRRLANALTRLGVQPGDRVGTLAWNGHRHFELYFAVSGMGAVIHTINPRLFPEQIAYIVNHAEDGYLCFDIDLRPAGREARTLLQGREGLDRDDGSRPHARQPDRRTSCATRTCSRPKAAITNGPACDENTASGLCYTSGTTGNPKGVLFSHRSTVLHAYAIVAARRDGPVLAQRRPADRADVPRERVGHPVRRAAGGREAGLPRPGPRRREPVRAVRDGEREPLFGGVPTVWLGLINHMQPTGLKFSTLEKVVIGGAAVPAGDDALPQRGVRDPGACTAGA